MEKAKRKVFLVLDRPPILEGNNIYCELIPVRDLRHSVIGGDFYSNKKFKYIKKARTIHEGLNYCGLKPAGLRH